MSYGTSDHLRDSGKTPAASADQTNGLARPGWPEIIVGLVVPGAVTIGVVLLARQLDLSPDSFGLILTALAGIGGIAGFAAAALLRIRSRPWWLV